MPFDALTLAAIRDEVAAMTGAQVQRIIQPAAAGIALSLYLGGNLRWLLLSADARYARVSFVDGRLAKAFATPSSFVMLLRKYLESSRLRSVSQAPEERILRLTFGPEEEPIHLVAEIMGRHSNIILLNDAEEILGAVKMVPPRLSRVRPILPGRAYGPPPVRDRDTDLFPSGPRLDPLTAAGALRALLERAPLNASLRNALLGLLPGASPFLVEQIILRAGEEPDVLSRDANLDAIQTASVQLYSLFRTREWAPVVFAGRRGACDFAPFPPIGSEGVQSLASMSAAVERCLGGHESRDAYLSLRKELNDVIEHARHAAERRAVAMREGIAASGKAEEVKERGQLLLAYQWALQPRASVLEIPDLQVSIPVDPSLNAADNAERLFRRYRKLRDAGRRLPALLAAAEAEHAHLEEQAVFAQLAESEGTLRDLLREVRAPVDEATSTHKKRTAKRGPLRLQRDEFTLLVGRSARENDEVTCARAGRQDLWFHARDRTGAHVVLQTGGPPFNGEIEAAAAAVAAHFSEGRQDTRVDVIVALVRDIRKVSGGPPGRVTYRNDRTITVAPSLDGWEPVSRKDR